MNALYNDLIRKLLFDTYSCTDISLYAGKMGISIFFYRYANKYKEDIYQRFAEMLLDEVSEDLGDSLSIDFETGLAGIGWGIDFLVYNNFVEGNVDDILQMIDYQIISNLSQDVSIQNMMKMSQYIICRLNNTKSNKIKKEYSSILQSYLNEFRNNSDIKQIEDYFFNIDSYNREKVLNKIPGNIIELRNNNLGLSDGLAGYLYKKLLV